MIVTCESCDRSFNLDDSRVKSAGSKVRCSKCKHVFVVYPKMPAEAPILEISEPVPGEAIPEFSGIPAAEERADAVPADTDLFPGSLFDNAVSDDAGEEDLDLSDIEKMLEMDQDTGGKAPDGEDLTMREGTSDAFAADSLDLSDFEKILEESDGIDEPVDEDTEEEPDLQFDLGEELEADTSEGRLISTPELDLGDLEKMFEPEEEKPDLSLEEEPSLDLSLDEEGGASFEQPEEMDDFGDLGFELEEDTPSSGSGTEDAPLEFDLALAEEDEEETPVLDFDLESEEKSGGEAEAALSLADDSFDLELELEKEGESPAAASADMDVPAAVDTFDMSDLEDMLEMEKAPDSRTDTKGAPDRKVSGDAPAMMELFPDFATAPPEETTAEGGEFAELDFPDDAVPDIPDEEEIPETKPSEVIEELDEVGMSDELRQAIAPNEGLKKIIFGGLMAVLVLLIAIAVLVFLQIRGIIHISFLEGARIPFVGTLKTSEAPDAGNLKMGSALEVDSRFLESAKAGRVFIVTGKVKNGYSDPRSHILVSSNLYIKGKTLAKTETAYCGNSITDLELSKLSPLEIKARLSNKNGDQNANVGIKPGETRSFMVVFSDLPESLDYFTVTVLSSSKSVN